MICFGGLRKLIQKLFTDLVRVKKKKLSMHGEAPCSEKEGEEIIIIPKSEKARRSYHDPEKICSYRRETPARCGFKKRKAATDNL